MSTNSERHHVQLYVEQAIGCASPESLREHRDSFRNFSIGHTDLAHLMPLCREDMQAYYRKGLRTILQSLRSLDEKAKTWSLVQLYYSIFYFQRARLASRGISFLRCGNIYTLEISLGEKPQEKKGDAYRGDHKATIKIYSDEFSQQDLFVSQNIEDINPFLWMSNKRDWVNYKRRDFIDEYDLPWFSSELMSFSEQVLQSCQDKVPIFCFDPEFSAIALPVKFAQQSIRLIDSDQSQMEKVLADLPEKTLESSSVKVFIENWSS